VINDVNVEVIVIEDCVTESGVCVWIKGEFGEMYLVSVYCQYGECLEPYFGYMDDVYERVNGKRILVGMDANAVSPMWHSKERGRSIDSIERGRLWEEWILEKDMHVLNEPCVEYTFNGMRGMSDIDVTLCDGHSVTDIFEWEIKSEWSISDHSMIMVRMKYGDNVRHDERVIDKKWSMKGVNWEMYVYHVIEKAEHVGIEEFERMSVTEKLRIMMEWIEEVNDKQMKRIVRINQKG
jgi:hypothetical protein